MKNNGLKNNELNLKDILYNFGLDHLEIFGIFKDKKLFNKLDFDNSNYSEFYEYKIIKTEVPRYAYKIIFNKWDYSLFAYYEGLPKTEKQPVATKSYIVVYSTAFKLLEYEEILGFLEWYLILEHIRRFDIALDLKININNLLENYFAKPKTGREYKKSWNIETLYFWEVKNSKNKRQLIRVYNKLQDIIEKKKVALYQDYLTNENITRVELEIRQELAKNRNYKDLFDDVLLIGIFKNYLYKYTKIFEQIPWERITLYKSKTIKLDNEDYQSLAYKVVNINQFIGYVKNIYNQWFCPVRMLIWEWYIKDKTKLALGVDKIEGMINKEREAKIKARENYYIRNNIDEILSNLYKYGKI